MPRPSTVPEACCAAGIVRARPAGSIAERFSVVLRIVGVGARPGRPDRGSEADGPAAPRAGADVPPAPGAGGDGARIRARRGMGENDDATLTFGCASRTLSDTQPFLGPIEVFEHPHGACLVGPEYLIHAGHAKPQIAADDDCAPRGGCE